MNMLRVIENGVAATVAAEKRTQTLNCPFCGSEPGLPRRIMTRFLMGCESDECEINPQAGGDTPEAAAKAWNTRAGVTV